MWKLFCKLILKIMGWKPVNGKMPHPKAIIQEMNERKEMHLAITPEGTRKLNKRWKAGFHTIAKATGATMIS